jgi:Ribbon-helix-helix protein, copG family
MAKKTARTANSHAYRAPARDPFHVKLNEEERGMLDRLAKREKITRAEMLRQLIRRAS